MKWMLVLWWSQSRGFFAYLFIGFGVPDFADFFFYSSCMKKTMRFLWVTVAEKLIFMWMKWTQGVPIRCKHSCFIANWFSGLLFLVLADFITVYAPFVSKQSSWIDFWHCVITSVAASCWGSRCLSPIFLGWNAGCGRYG